MIEILSYEVGFCTVGIGEESLAQVPQGAGFAVAVGIGGVLHGAGDYGFTLADLHSQDRAKFCG